MNNKAETIVLKEVRNLSGQKHCSRETAAANSRNWNDILARRRKQKLGSQQRRAFPVGILKTYSFLGKTAVFIKRTIIASINSTIQWQDLQRKKSHVVLV